MAEKCPIIDCEVEYLCMNPYNQRVKKNGKPICCGTCIRRYDNDCHKNCSREYGRWTSKEGWTL